MKAARKIFVILSIASGLEFCALPTFAQTAFQNLDFESANLAVGKALNSENTFMFMKHKILAAIVLLTFGPSLIATVQMPFQGWQPLLATSPNIVIARPGRRLTGGIHHGALIEYEGNITGVLKGPKHVGASNLRLSDELWLRPDEDYLIFGYGDDSLIQANESYRVIPLGPEFSINILAGKPVDDQIKLLIKRRIDFLNSQITREQDERSRLIEGLK